MRLSRRSLLKTAARLGAGAGLALLGLGGAERSEAQEESEGPYFRESATKLTLGNQYYEVDFDKRNGAITRIFDKRGSGVVSEGNAYRSLWALFTDGSPVWIGSREVSQSTFQWKWDASSSVLHLSYAASNTAIDIEATIDVRATEQPWIDLQAYLDHRRGPRIDWLSFPNELTFPAERISEAFFPYLPGVMLSERFFRNRRSHLETYPGKGAFADITWLDLDTGRLSCYPLFGGSRYWQTRLGFQHSHDSEDNVTAWVHRIAAGLSAPNTMRTPTIRLTIGEAAMDVLKMYREQNQLDRYPSLRERLGDSYEAIRHAPMIELWPRGEAFESHDEALDRIESPALLTLPGLTDLAFDANLPDALDVSSRRGGVAGFRRAFAPRQADGFILAPYTNPTWCNPGTPTAQWLSDNGWSLEDVSVRRPDGTIHRSTLPDGSAWPGVLLSLADPRVERRLADILSDHDLVGSDVILEDQIGARDWYFDYHPTAKQKDVLHYARSWIDYSRKYHDRPAIAEGGYDRLAETYYGFWWNIHRMKWGIHDAINGYGKFGDGPTDEWKGYPAFGAMLRDRAIDYDHDFQGELSSDSRDGLRSFTALLVHGVMPEMTVFDSTSPSLGVVTDFTHHVIGNHIDELVTSFHRSEDVTMTVYETTTVKGNWSDEPVEIEGHTLVPGGFVFSAHDLSVLGGVFQRYNNRDLSDGDHYLIEQRRESGLIVRQPMGDETQITVEAMSGWGSNLMTMVRAFRRDDQVVGKETIRAREHAIQFLCRSGSASDDLIRALAEASIDLGEANMGHGLREVQQRGHRSDYGRRGGRWGRTETQASGAMVRRGEVDPHGWLWFKVASQAVEEDRSREYVVQIEYFDDWSEVGEWSGGAAIGVQVRLATGDLKWHWLALQNDKQWRITRFTVRDPVWVTDTDGEWSIGILVNAGVYVGHVSVTSADEIERRTAAYYTIHDPAQGEALTQGLHLRGWTDATQPIADLNLDGLQAIYAWDAEAASWLLYSPDVPARFNTLDTLEQGRAYYVRVRNGQTLHWPEAPYGGVGFHLQPGRNLVCWLGTPDKSLTDAIAPLRGMKAEPLVSVTLSERTYDVEESRSATEPLPYGQVLWVEIDAVGPTRWLQF